MTHKNDEKDAVWVAWVEYDSYGEFKKIGSSKTISSNGLTVDRDINGARGIFLRALRDTSVVGNSNATC